MGNSATESEQQVTPAAKIVYSLALVIGIFAGMFFGFWKAALVLEPYYSARRSSAPMALDEFSLMQYRHADADHAKTALLTFVGLLEALEAVSPDRGEQRKLATTYTRLALLEDSANHAQASHNYMVKARYWYGASGGRDYSDSEMKAALRAADERLQQLGIR